MASKEALKLFSILGAAVVAGAFILWIAPRSDLLCSRIERDYPGLIPASSYARLLDSVDPDTVMRGFYYLEKRANRIAVPRAIELLGHSDDYIWLNAALYLGACKRQEAVPYLIKALRHTASRADPKTTKYLRAITGVDYGSNFKDWQEWWLAGHPGFQFDWDSRLGHAPRV